MKILFKSPEFATIEKETEFLQVVKKVSAYKNMETMVTHFLLELDNSLGVETIQQLFRLFDAWKIDNSPLELFVQYIEMESKKDSVHH